MKKALISAVEAIAIGQSTGYWYYMFTHNKLGISRSSSGGVSGIHMTRTPRKCSMLDWLPIVCIWIQSEKPQFCVFINFIILGITIFKNSVEIFSYRIIFETIENNAHENQFCKRFYENSSTFWFFGDFFFALSIQHRTFHKYYDAANIHGIVAFFLLLSILSN